MYHCPHLLTLKYCKMDSISPDGLFFIMGFLSSWIELRTTSYVTSTERNWDLIKLSKQSALLNADVMGCVSISGKSSV